MSKNFFESRIFYRLLIFILVFLASSFNVSSVYKIDNSSINIEKKYFEGDMIRGSLRMNFSNQEDANFSSNFEGGISLNNLLKDMNYAPGNQYKCNPVTCDANYNVVSEMGAGGTFTLDQNKEEIYGFRILINKEIKNITSFGFNISSNAARSCQNQLSIDLLNDDVIEFENTEYYDIMCGSWLKGCFKEQGVIIYTPLRKAPAPDSGPYCEKFENVPPAPAYRVGAFLKAGTLTGGNEIIVRLYSLRNDNSYDRIIGTCRINAVPSDGARSCDVNKSVSTAFNASVCIYTAEEGENLPQIRYREPPIESPDGCGATTFPDNEDPMEFDKGYDYEIIMAPLQYDSIEEMRVGSGKTEEIKSYIQRNYNNNCTNGCFVPFRIKSNVPSQQITLSHGGIKGTTQQVDFNYISFIKLNKSPYTISASNMLINLEKMNLKVPNVNGTHQFYLCFGLTGNDRCNEVAYIEGKTIADKAINVMIGEAFDIFPKRVPIGIEVDLFAFTADKQINSSYWEFKGTTFNSPSDRTTHTFIDLGEEDVKVTVTLSSGETSTKRFKVIVENPKESADKLISDYKERIADIKEDLGEYDSWMRSKLSNSDSLDLNNTEINLQEIATRFEVFKADETSTDKNFTQIVNSLLGLNIPARISLEEEGELPARAYYSSLDPDLIAEISGVTISSENREREKIIAWIYENYELNIEFKKLVLVYSNKEKKTLAGFYKISLDHTGNKNESYLIIDYPKDDLNFKSSYEASSLNSGASAYIKVDKDGPDVVEFLVLDDAPDVEDLGVYISSRITPGNICLTPACLIDPDAFQLKNFIIAAGILLALFILALLFIQFWYKKHYERHLFKTKDDLYNLVSFVYNSRKSENSDGETRRKLIEKGWTREQVNYAFKKIDGRRVNALEIPLFKFMENRKVKKELEGRVGGVDTRFIKRRYF